MPNVKSIPFGDLPSFRVWHPALPSKHFQVFYGSPTVATLSFRALLHFSQTYFWREWALNQSHPLTGRESSEMLIEIRLTRSHVRNISAALSTSSLRRLVDKRPCDGEFANEEDAAEGTNTNSPPSSPLAAYQDLKELHREADAEYHGTLELLLFKSPYLKHFSNYVQIPTDSIPTTISDRL
ncbi:hypothetical protein FRC00_009405 [Tulasnella sp. 408]|nr:hypothetical protein FRC00_009405 [Tulasnella sp. 408]